MADDAEGFGRANRRVQGARWRLGDGTIEPRRRYFEGIAVPEQIRVTLGIEKVTDEMRNTGTVVYGHAGRNLGEFGWIHAIACPSEDEIWVGELTTWRVQKLVSKR